MIERFTPQELKIFNLLRAGKTKTDIINEKVTTTSNLNFLLSSIYKKTEDMVKYHSEKNKYEELLEFIRKNFPPMPEKSNDENSQESGGNTEEKLISADKIISAIDKLKKKYEAELDLLKMKLDVLDDVILALDFDIEQA